MEPILRTFDPDFILLSSGFDAARYDLLGGFTLTPNGYYYLTKRIMELGKKMLVVLEGGYSIRGTSSSSVGVMKALIDDETLPEPIKVSEEHMKEVCALNKVIHEQIDKIIEILG